MAEIKLRYNSDSEEVELVVDGEVALASGNDVFVSWVADYNEKHKPAEAPVEQSGTEAGTEGEGNEEVS